MSTLTDYPWLVFVLSLLMLWLCAQLGAALRRKREARGQHAPETYTIVLTAALTLLGLIIGFTFSMAVSRYDMRKNYEAEEANAIGTEYLRVGLLSPGDAAMTRMLLRSYLDQRILLYHSAEEHSRGPITQRTIELQRQLWSTVQRAAIAQPSALTALAAAGLNDVLNAQSYTQAAWWNRIPLAAWGLMGLIAVAANLILGYGERQTDSLMLLVLPVVISIAIFLIADIDSPRGGVIRVAPQNLLSQSQLIGHAQP